MLCWCQSPVNNQPARQLRAAVYVRVSSDEQTRGYGLEYQLEDCRRAIAQHGHTLVEVYSDPGISGTVEDRPGLGRLRQDARNDRFDILYFWKSDRLARDEILQLTLYREFRGLGIETYSVSEPSMNDLMRGIYAVFGAEDLRNLKSKMYSGRIRAWKDGKWIGAVPFGYTKNTDHRLEIHEPEARWVRTLFEWFVRDRMTIHGLVQRAFANGVPTRWDGRGRQKPRNGACYWSKGTLTRLLSRAYYATGDLTVKAKASRVMGHTATAEDAVIAIPAPPIISMELFEAAQEQLKHNHVYARRRSQRIYLFAKKLRCGVCRRSLAGEARPDRPGKIYKGNRSDMQVRCVSCRYYRESTLDEAIWPKLRELFENPTFFLAELTAYANRNDRSGELAEERLALEHLEAKVEQQEETLLQYDLERFYSPSVLAKKRADLVALRHEVSQRSADVERRQRAERNVHATAADVEHLYERIRDVLDESDYDTRATVYKWLIDRIVLTGSHAEVWLTIPTGASTPGTESDTGGDGGRETNGVSSILFGPSQSTQFIAVVSSRSFNPGEATQFMSQQSHKARICQDEEHTMTGTSRLPATHRSKATRLGNPGRSTDDDIIIPYFSPAGVRKGSLLVFALMLERVSDPAAQPH